MLNWKAWFDSKILERGKDYFRGGAVQDLEIDEEEISAVVEGTEDYQVTISLEDGEIDEMDCTCPYAEEHDCCKHMAAVLYAYEEALENKKGKAQPDKTEKLTREQLCALVEKTDVQTVRQFLSDVLWNEEKYRVRFQSMVSPDFAKQALNYAKKRFSKIERNYVNGSGYLSYRQGKAFIREVEQWIDEEIDPRVERHEYAAAFELSNLALFALANVDIDDDEYGLDVIAEYCQGVWRTMLDAGDLAIEKTLFSWFTTHISDSVHSLIVDAYETVLMEYFVTPEYLNQKLALYQAKLEKLDKDDSTYARNRAQEYLRRCFSLMRQMRRPEEEIQALQQKYWALPCVREQYMEQCEKERRWDDLIAVLKESIEIEKKQKEGYAVSKYEIRLKEAYQKAGKTAEYKTQLWRIMTEIRPQEIDYFREYKGIIPEAEWPEERERVFFALKSKSYLLPSLYYEEKLYDRLMQYLQETHSFEMLVNYEKDLLPLYPEVYLHAYVDRLTSAARNTADRKTYQEWVDTLRHMRKIPGGKEAAKQIVNEWKAIYGNRRAMMEELKKLEK